VASIFLLDFTAGGGSASAGVLLHLGRAKALHYELVLPVCLIFNSLSVFVY